MKKMIYAALIAACIGCSNQEDVVMETGKKASLSVKLNFSEFQTKSGDQAIEELPEWHKLLLIVTDANDAIIQERIIDRTENNGSLDNSIQLFEKSENGTKFIGGKVKAFVVVKDNDWGEITTDYKSSSPNPNLPSLASEQNDINNWQLDGFIKEDIKGKFVNVPFYGISEPIIDNGPSGDGHHQLTATVNVKPELGRIQVLKEPKSGGSKVVNGNTIIVTKLTVENIYVNRVETGGSIVDIRTIDGTNVESNWFDKFYGVDMKLKGLTDIGTNKGYQIYDNNTPHVIVKVKYQLNNIETDYTGYLTIMKYTYGEVESGDLQVSKGKIYDIDLSQLTPTYDQIGEEPYDKNVYYDLSVNVVLQNWSIITVKPEL